MYIDESMRIVSIFSVDLNYMTRLQKLPRYTNETQYHILRIHDNKQNLKK